MLDTEALGRLISSIGRPGFDAIYFDLARNTLDINTCTAFAFSDGSPPFPVVLEGIDGIERDLTRTLGSAYVKSGYRQDPQLKDLYSIADLEVRTVIPGEISDTAYREQYYGQAGIASEITVLWQFRKRRFNVSFYRHSHQRRFDAMDVEKARALAQISLPVLYRHVELCQVDPDYEVVGRGANKSVLEHLAAVLLAEGHGLSPREAEVCASIILGYKTLAISLNLGISENTICTHRKRAYAKLGISSQNELFSRYFRTLSRLERVAA